MPIFRIHTAIMYNNNNNINNDNKQSCLDCDWVCMHCDLVDLDLLLWFIPRIHRQLLQPIQCVHPVDDMAEDGVFAIQMRMSLVRDEELTP